MSVHTPKSLAEAYEILSAVRPRVIAGGTDLMVIWNSTPERPSEVMSIWGLKELAEIEEQADTLRLGALCTYTQLIHDARVQRYAPALVEASRTIGAVQIQNRGTLGGNVVNASPAGDSLPVLAAFDATVEIGSARGVRSVAFNSFYTGYRSTVLEADEMVTALVLPKQREDERSCFYKVGTRAAQAISKVMMAVRATVADGRVDAIAIAVGSVAPTVIRARETERLIEGHRIDEPLIEAARAAMMNEVRPITDVRSNERYRRTVSGNLVARFLRECL